MLRAVHVRMRLPQRSRVLSLHDRMRPCGNRAAVHAQKNREHSHGGILRNIFSRSSSQCIHAAGLGSVAGVSREMISKREAKTLAPTASDCRRPPGAASGGVQPESRRQTRWTRGHDGHTPFAPRYAAWSTLVTGISTLNVDPRPTVECTVTENSSNARVYALRLARLRRSVLRREMDQVFRYGSRMTSAPPP